MIYTDITFRLDTTVVIKTARISALVLACVATSTWAQDDNSTTAASADTWRASAIARCAQQYSDEQCQDSTFLEENFHINTLEIAHHTAMQRNREAEKALRELTLQRVCRMPVSDTCASSTANAQCITQTEQACTALQTEAANCVQNALSACSSDTDPDTCSKNRIARCPSLKKQPIEWLLAKYPKLTAAQKSQLVATATALDAQTGWWPNLIARLKAPFR